MSAPNPPERNSTGPTPPQSDSPQPALDKTSELKRTVQDARKEARRGGDVNVIQVDEGAHVEQIGIARVLLQTKINIGRIEVSVRFLLGLVLVALVIAVAVWWIATPGQIKAGEGAASIAIVDFGSQDAAGNISSSDQGAYLSTWLYNRLQAELDDPSLKPPPVIWHISTGLDPIHLFQKRVFSGPVRNDQDAEKVAGQFNADIVIYGTLEPGQGAVNFVPQFHVREPRTSQEAPELSGSQQMGKPISLPTPFTNGSLETYVQPLGRAVLVLSRGLSFDFTGNFAKAYGEFQQDEPKLQEWDENQGKEIFYFFKGSEALFLAQCQDDAARVFAARADRSSVDQALDQAELDFNEAKRIQPQYARAYFGLAQVNVQRAQRLVLPPDAKSSGQCRLPNNLGASSTSTPQCPAPPSGPPDAARLDQARTLYLNAIDLHNKALDLMKSSSDTLLLHRIQAARATTELPLAQVLLLRGDVAGAEALLQNGVTALDTVKESIDAQRDPRGLATLYLSLGNGRFLQAYARAIQNDPDGNKTHLNEAVGAFGMCLTIIRQNPADHYLGENLYPNCFCTQAAAQKALDQGK